MTLIFAVHGRNIDVYNNIFFKGFCKSGFAYLSGTMVLHVVDISTTKDCLNMCNSRAPCKFWDFDTTNNICRLRSNEGRGRIARASYYGGPKNCLWGKVVNRIY